ncbi:hypothetical protein DIPPA_14595 [Diplonema papillatum]|nr:hypothetical protein DIPPA_14595 [Diplonema papillatum]
MGRYSKNANYCGSSDSSDPFALQQKEQQQQQQPMGYGSVKAYVTQREAPASGKEKVALKIKCERVATAVLHVVNNVRIAATADEECVEVDLRFELEVLTAKYHLVPVLQNTYAILDMNVTGETAENPLHLFPKNGWHNLMAHGAGVYQVTLKFLAPYSTAIKQSVNLPCLPALDTTISLELPEEHVVSGIACKPVSSFERSGNSYKARLPPVTTIALKWISSDAGIDTAGSMTSFTSLTSDKQQLLLDGEAPPAPGAGRTEAPPPAKELVVTSAQDVTHAIGGGVCSTSLFQSYTIAHGDVSSFVLKVGRAGSVPTEATPRDWAARLDDLEHHTPVKVIAVTGTNIKRWEYTDGEVRVYMDSPVVASQSFTVRAEMDLKASSCHLMVPSFTPLQVNRNRGAVGIKALTAVEVVEGDIRGAMKVDVAELPASFARSSALLLAFKYLGSNYRICLRVTKHDVVDVVTALCESASYQLTYSSGQFMYQLTYNIRNTQCQYIKVGLPANANIWSATIAGEPVKPAKDSDGCTLLALLKGTVVAFTATLTYVTPAPPLPMSKSEVKKFASSFPAVNLPIMHMRVQLWLSEKLKYGTFLGDLKEVRSFTANRYITTVHDGGQYNDVWNRAGACNKKKKMPAAPVLRGRALASNAAPQVNRASDRACMRREDSIILCQLQQQQQNVSNFDDDASRSSCSQDAADDSDSTDDLDEDEMDAIDISAGKTMTAGIRPLQLNTSDMKVGSHFLLERLLVPSKRKLQIEADSCFAARKSARTLASDRSAGSFCAMM